MKRFFQKNQIVWLVGLITALCIWIPQFVVPGLYDRLNNLVFDTYQQAKPRQWAGSNVVVLDIDEESIKQIGQWPWPRDFMAKMTDKLGEMGAATIVFDIVFSEPDRTSPILSLERLRFAGAEILTPANSDRLDNDLIFADAIARNHVVTGLVLSRNSKIAPPAPKAGHGFVGSEPSGIMTDQIGAIRNLEVLDHAAKGIGLFSLSSEFLTDGIIRQVRLLRGVGGNFYPTLTMEALRVAQGAGSFKLKSSNGSGEANAGELRMVSVQVGAIDVPTSAVGDLPIYHSLTNSKPNISARDFMFPEESGLSNEDLAEMIEGHIVLIGASAEGLLDLRSTPSEPVVPGVYIHADIADQILSGSYLVRPDYAKGVELSSSIFAVIFLLLVRPFVNSILGGITAIFICVGAVWFFWIQFSQELQLFSPVLLLISVIASYSTATAALFLVTEKESQFLRGAFSQYLSPTLVDRLARNPERLTLGGEEKELTVLFCDIRGFTSLSEKLDPTELTELLNSFLTPMTGILLENGATIDKYMGDAIMAFWNAPIDQDDHRQMACRSILEMRRALEKLNQKRGLDLQIGVGLNTGLACVGNLGSDQRFSYSAIGDAVNVASRVEGLTKQYGLDNLVTEETLLAVEGIGHIEIDRVAVVGRDEPTSVYHFFEQADATSKIIVDAHAELISTYQNGNLKQAQIQVDYLMGVAPQSLKKLYQVYADRICEMSSSGLPDDWDGVYVAKDK